jgi:hypothetical protein
MYIWQQKKEDIQAYITTCSSKLKLLQIDLTPAKKGMSTVNANVKIFQVFCMCKLLNEISTSLTKCALKQMLTVMYVYAEIWWTVGKNGRVEDLSKTSRGLWGEGDSMRDQTTFKKCQVKWKIELIIMQTQLMNQIYMLSKQVRQLHA